MDRLKAETQIQKAKTQSHSSYQCPSCNLVANVRNTSNALLLLYCNLAAHLTKEYLKCFIGTMSLHKRKMRQTQQKFPINSTNSPNLAKICKYAFYREWCFKWSGGVSLEGNSHLRPEC